MKRIVSSICVLALLFVNMTGTTVMAQQSEVTTQNTTEETYEQRKAEREALREQAVADRKATFDAARQLRIASRCSAVKARIASIGERVAKIESARGNVASNVLEKLQALSERAVASELDTTNLDADIATLKTKADGVRSLWSTYKTTLTNLAETDCEDDVQAFHDALEATKIAHSDVRDAYKDIRDFVSTEVKGSLSELREQIKALKADSDSTADEGASESEE